MEYRIVRRNKSPYTGGRSSYDYYYAQMKIFGTWIDCRFNPFIETYNSFDNQLHVVDNWVHMQINGKEPMVEEVVKTYD